MECMALCIFKIIKEDSTVIKELTQSNFPNTDIGGDIQSVNYMGFPMPDVHDYISLNVFGSALNLSADEFIEEVKSGKHHDLQFCYSPGHTGDGSYLWKLTAYAKYEASGNYPDKDIVFLYYSPVNQGDLCY